MAINNAEVLKINESSLIKEMLIYELQEVEKATGFITISSEKELVNYALINLLHDYKEAEILEGTVNLLSDNLELYLKEKFSTTNENEN